MQPTLRCGFLFEPIPIKCGCRQRDPISAYLFWLVAEGICIHIGKPKNISGILIANFTLKLTQFAKLVWVGSEVTFERMFNVSQVG